MFSSLGSRLTMRGVSLRGMSSASQITSSSHLHHHPRVLVKRQMDRFENIWGRNMKIITMRRRENVKEKEKMRNKNRKKGKI
jgi:hypothetical protein